MKNTFAVLRSKGVALKTAVVAAGLGLAASASAELPTWATGIGADAQSTATDAAALVGPVIGGVLISLVAIKLIKRFVNRI